MRYPPTEANARLLRASCPMETAPYITAINADAEMPRYSTSRLTILFDDPFWIGLYEREDDTEYSVCRIVFGAEPRDQEVYAYLLEHWRTLRFSPPRPGTEHLPPPKSPKRRQREARRMTQAAGIGTKAQQALKLQQEQGKQARLARTRQQREAEEARKFQLRQARRKEKHRGH